MFPASDQQRLAQTPLYRAYHRLRSGRQRLVVRVPARQARPASSFHLAIDRIPDDNILALGTKAESRAMKRPR